MLALFRITKKFACGKVSNVRAAKAASNRVPECAARITGGAKSSIGERKIARTAISNTMITSLTSCNCRSEYSRCQQKRDWLPRPQAIVGVCLCHSAGACVRVLVKSLVIVTFLVLRAPGVASAQAKDPIPDLIVKLGLTIRVRVRPMILKVAP